VVIGELNCLIKELTLKMAKMPLLRSHDEKLLLEEFLTEKRLESAVPNCSYALRSNKKKVQKKKPLGQAHRD
jgi:hypothetical protein